MPLKTKAELHQLVEQIYEILKSHDVATCVQLLHTLQTDAVRECAEMVRVQPIHSDFSLSHPNGEKLMADKLLSTISDNPL